MKRSKSQFSAVFAAFSLCTAVLAGAPARAQNESGYGFEPPVSEPAIPSRAEAAEMGDQRQREILRGPFRSEQNHTRGRDEPEAAEKVEPQQPVDDADYD